MRVSGCKVYFKCMHGLPLCAGPGFTITDFSLLRKFRAASGPTPALTLWTFWADIPGVNRLCLCVCVCVCVTTHLIAEPRVRLNGAVFVLPCKPS